MQKQKNINIFKCQDLIINKVEQVVTDGAGKGPDWPGCRWASGVAGKVLILELWWWLQRHLPWNNSLSHPSVCFYIYVALKKIFRVVGKDVSRQIHLVSEVFNQYLRITCWEGGLESEA